MSGLSPEDREILRRAIRAQDEATLKLVAAVREEGQRAERDASRIFNVIRDVEIVLTVFAWGAALLLAVVAVATIALAIKR